MGLVAAGGVESEFSDEFAGVFVDNGVPLSRVKFLAGFSPFHSWGWWGLLGTGVPPLAGAPEPGSAVASIAG